MNLLRQILPLEREYAARGLLTRSAIGVDGPIAVHAAGWKTASQWLRMVLSDPSLLRRAGFEAVYVRGRAGDSGLRADMLRANRLLTPVYATADHPLLAAHEDRALRVAAVVREPVDLVRSWYRSNAFGHPENPDVTRRRAMMAAAGSAPVDQLRALLAEDDFAEVLRIGTSWIERARWDDGVAIIDFADLTGEPITQATALASMLEHLGLPADADRVARLIHRYGRARLARVERVLRPPTQRKYDAASSQASPPELTDAIVAELLAERARTGRGGPP